MDFGKQITPGSFDNLRNLLFIPTYPAMLLYLHVSQLNVFNCILYNVFLMYICLAAVSTLKRQQLKLYTMQKRIAIWQCQNMPFSTAQLGIQGPPQHNFYFRVFHYFSTYTLLDLNQINLHSSNMPHTFPPLCDHSYYLLILECSSPCHFWILKLYPKFTQKCCVHALDSRWLTEHTHLFPPFSKS